MSVTAAASRFVVFLLTLPGRSTVYLHSCCRVFTVQILTVRATFSHCKKEHFINSLFQDLTCEVMRWDVLPVLKTLNCTTPNNHYCMNKVPSNNACIQIVSTQWFEDFHYSAKFKKWLSASSVRTADKWNTIPIQAQASVSLKRPQHGSRQISHVITVLNLYINFSFFKKNVESRLCNVCFV